MTNTYMAFVDNNLPVVIPNAEGDRATPTIVFYDQDGICHIGKAAMYWATKELENSFSNLKQFIGRRYNEISQEIAQVPYEAFNDSQGNILLNCPNLPQPLPPQEILAALLRKLANDASTYLGEAVTGAVLTVPNHFNDWQRQAMKDAGKLAGLEIYRILNESTAAAIACGLHERDNELILVFSLGSTMLEVNVLEVADGVFEPLATVTSNLGSNDFNQRIIAWLLNELQRQKGVDLHQYPQALPWLNEVAERTKIELSTHTKTAIAFPFLAPTGMKLFEQTLSRVEFEQLCSDLFDRCRACIQQVLTQAQTAIGEMTIDHVVSIGGSTRMPAVQALIHEATGKYSCQRYVPTELVAIGAAIRASLHNCDPTVCINFDYTSLSLGIETSGGIMTKLIERLTHIPCQKTVRCTTTTDGQTSVEIHILRGERFLAKDNQRLGTLKLDGILPMPKGVPEIKITFDIDYNGILTVTVKDLATEQQAAIALPQATVVDSREADRIRNDAERHAEDDQKLREPVIAREKAENLIAETQRQLSELLDKVAVGDKACLDEVIQQLQGTLEQLPKLSEPSASLVLMPTTSTNWD